MISINLLQVFLWTFRRGERDVVNLYNSLSPLMQLATDNNMLNFGYWKNNPADPLGAQNELCKLVGEMSDLDSASVVLDVGSGFSVPATYWKSQYENINITCINTNFQQLVLSTKLVGNNISNMKENLYALLQTDDVRFVNATSTSLPISNRSADRIIALESAQHFRPLNQFVKESKKVLKNNGILIIAVPVTKIPSKLVSIMKLGILSFTWASEHYSLDYVKSTIINEGFHISEIQSIGPYVYDPLADYYMKNRKYLRERILKKYPSYLENILYKSLLKMKQVSQKGFIDYVLIKCKPSGTSQE
ncbi:methyltransferase domain-containing protein [Candidatus Pacearchaeota archaeon]|nr:methyltransferase domain-containing protein [Candidatus Pacearchaeota archaeon]